MAYYVFYDKILLGVDIVKHLGSQKLETKRLLLKKDSEEDKKTLWDNLFSDKISCKKCNWIEYENKDEFFKLKYDLPLNIYCWTIWLKDKNIPIGGISVHHQEDSQFKCEIGYSIHPNYWKNGYCSEALNEVLNFLINKVGYERVTGECTLDNIGSKRVMEKCNMKFEGIKRKSYYKDNKFYDNYLFSKIKEDYLEVIK